MPLETPWTINWLKKVYLTGIDLTDDQGNAFPDDIYQFGLDSAKQWLMNQLDIVIPKATYTDRHDFNSMQFGEWWLINLDRRPVRQIKEIHMQFGSMEVLQIPSSWITEVVPETGQVQLVPDSGTLMTWPLAQLAFYAASMLSTYGKVPGWYRVVYDAGYDTTEMPYDVLDLGGKHAAIHPLITAGNLIIGAGLASKTVAVDGVSQSVNTTLAPSASGYGSMLTQYRRDIDRDLPIVRRRFHGMPMRVV
jgi:hypothetical protein